MTERLAAKLFRQVDGAGLAAFRILFGVVMFGALVRLIASGWIEPLFTQPFRFKYPGFEWVPALPGPWLYVQAVVLALLAACIALGLFYRFACAAFAFGFAWLELIDVTNYLNHYYLVVVLAVLMAFLPLGRVFSLDAKLGLTRPAQVLPAWCLYLVRFQVGVVYVFAGLAKLGSDWLLHAQPLSIWMSARTETPLIGPLLAEPLAAFAMSWAGFLFDTTVVVWLLVPRTRLLAYVVLCTFHFFTGVFFDIGIFPWLMTTAALVFFPPDWPRRLLGLRAVRAPKALPLGWMVHRRAGAALAATWCAFHVALPLRHYASPGDVLWNEEGMRWSWKVMLREKQGSVTYRVREPATGREWQVSPSRYLTPRQEKEMSGQPDLILQLAQHIGREAQARGVQAPEVRVDALVSLNGRKAAPLLHPEVDLLRLPPESPLSRWILPAPAEPPLSPFAAHKRRRPAQAQEERRP